jgi:hypothetical protein
MAEGSFRHASRRAASAGFAERTNIGLLIASLNVIPRFVIKLMPLMR